MVYSPPMMMKTLKEAAAKPANKRGSVASKTANNGAAHDSLRAQGLRTRNAIIEVARALLLEAGSLEFSLREVAARAGISISNVQYYFPTRLAVLRAVVEPVIEGYLGELQRACDSKESPRVTLNALAKRALGEARSAEASALWWHFASFATIDAECSRLLDEWYETLTRGIAQIIRAAYPAFSEAESLHRATLLIAMSDGINYQLGAGRRKRDYTRGLDEMYLAAAECLLHGELEVKR